MIAIVGVVAILSMHNYFISRNKDIIILNNEIYRTFLELEKSGLIKKYENSLIEEENNRSLKKMNSIIQKRNKDISISVNNIDNYFYKDTNIFIGEANLLSDM